MDCIAFPAKASVSDFLTKRHVISGTQRLPEFPESDARQTTRAEQAQRPNGTRSPAGSDLGKRTYHDAACESTAARDVRRPSATGSAADEKPDSGEHYYPYSGYPKTL